MASIEFPEDLIELERSAWAQIQRGELTVATARKVHEAVAAFAEQAGLRRMDVELGLKTLVRYETAA
ncbi:hypothetical protein OG819_42320 [Streptomyces sp. NBC_01549]|uniref:hypothetical protein n=1 Tax=Streptomyces sp. NBC_01549 TaxID=2975874 RepID=UPI00225541C9|nr:hypothetical protein [Streptomyces sp. NBC_01549]MCX4596051.1 hypothetical protein [Streptomyces sp. NBC_01549]